MKGPVQKRFIVVLVFSTVLGLCSFATWNAEKMNTNVRDDTPSRNQKLPLFNPHLPSFSCELEANKVPPIDAQAEAWFHEASALNSADIFPSNRDYKRIVELTRQAAERHHWKAMLNLASLYVEGHDPTHGVEDAVQLVETAMRLGIPAAYDRMGTYFMNGTGVDANATRAYAFWQRAAEMGSPAAMAFLGEKIDAVWDDPHGAFWGNRAVGIQMLECAFSQANGDAAYELAKTISTQPGRASTREERSRALRILHQGVQYGSEACANALAIEFGKPFDLASMLAPNIDRARSERYWLLGEALGFDPKDRFPNLDKVLPLPPAKLPPWNGDRDTLLNAARGVTPPQTTPRPSAEAQRSGRYHLNAAFSLRDTGQETRDLTAPVEGYWQPTGPVWSSAERTQLEVVPPGLYRRGEEFPILVPQHGANGANSVIWRRWDTIRHDPEAVEPLAPIGWTRICARPQPLISAPSTSPCPIQGTWQPWVASDHPLQACVNQYWRQAWLTVGQPFPHPEKDWMLSIPATDIVWHLMDSEITKLL